jgi:hypothetical protein
MGAALIVGFERLRAVQAWHSLADLPGGFSASFN